MPKSKRSKVVHLTKTDRKGSEGKAKVIGSLREGIDEFDNMIIFTFESMRTNYFKELRKEWADSRFYLGKNKVMQIAIGKTKEDAFRPNLHKMSTYLQGQCGVLLTNAKVSSIRKSFEGFHKKCFARAGALASQTVKLDEGVLQGHESSKVEYFRKLGMPVKVQNSQLYLMETFVVCREGRKMSPEQCSILKQLGLQMATMKLRVVASWSDGKVRSFADE